MHLADQHQGEPGFRILILTYSKALTRDLHRLLENKIRDHESEDALQYKRMIVVDDIEHLMESILNEGLGTEEAEKWRAEMQAGLSTPSDYLDFKLPEKCQDILYLGNEQFQLYDYLLVDEVQDFSDFFLDVAMCLLKKRENIFMVGDTGQKLFNRRHSLSDLGIVEERARIRGHYRMYRNPKLIAQLAWNFLRLDHLIIHDLREEEYADEIKSKNSSLTQPVFKYFQTREILFAQVCEDIIEIINFTFRARHEQILCIGLPDTLALLHHMLIEKAIPVCWAHEISSESKVILADFTASKGLEREYVYILDVDRLPDGGLTQERLFSSSHSLEVEARSSRIKIFVALTRVIHELYLYYTNPSYRFIRELQALQRAQGSTK